MKIKPITFIAILSCIQLGAQNEYFQNNPTWAVQKICMGFGTSGYEFYWVSGNETLEGIEYVEISNAYLMRSEDRKMFWINPDSGDEEMIYDFNVEVGDSFYVHPMMHSENYFPVSEVDSMLIGDSWRRVVHLNSGDVLSPFIEGIGHQGGFIEEAYNLLDCVQHLCCYSDDNGFYIEELLLDFFWDGVLCELTDSIQGCLDVVEIEERMVKEKPFIIYPNPADEALHISLDMPTSYGGKFRLLDTQGRLLSEMELAPMVSTFYLDVSKFDAGYYLLEYADTSGIRSVLPVQILHY